VASQLQSESQNIDIQLSTVMNANDANIINNEIFYLHEKMDAFINSLSSSHLADVNYLENIADDLKEVIEQKISIKKLILDKENKIKTDRNEMENISVSSAIIIKRTLTMSNEPDEFLIKDIESYLEKIN
ncbi:methyl-accepting chemotaxis protein, partial [Vibrio cholerae]|nr:methyl-accepting chemotaxis protein [Vibrio cholerae]